MRGCLGVGLVVMAILCILLGVAFPPLLITGIGVLVVGPVLSRAIFGKRE